MKPFESDERSSPQSGIGERLKRLGLRTLALIERKPWIKYVLVLCLFLLYIVVGTERNLINYFKLQDQYQDLKAQYEQEQTNYEQDSLRITQSKGGASEIERLARERYYMKEEGEDIYLIKPDSNFAPPTNP